MTQQDGQTDAGQERRGRQWASRMDGLHRYGLPSKGDTRLLDFSTQESYYDEIVQQYARRCHSLVSTPIEPLLAALAIVDKRNDAAEASSLGSLWLAMRKLREGIVATNRSDSFAVEAYHFCVRAAILAGHVESYHPALSHLVRTLHPKARAAKAVTEAERQEFVVYLILDLACRQQQPAEAYRVRARRGCRGRLVDAVLEAIVHGNYQLFHTAQRGASEIQARLMEHADDRIRRLAIQRLERAYFTVDKHYLNHVTGLKWEQLQHRYGLAWDTDGERVIMRRPKRR